MLLDAGVVVVRGGGEGARWLEREERVEQSGGSVKISRQSLLVFIECLSIVMTGDRRIMELERTSLLLAILVGRQCQCLVVTVVVQKQTLQ